MSNDTVLTGDCKRVQFERRKFKSSHLVFHLGWLRSLLSFSISRCSGAMSSLLFHHSVHSSWGLGRCRLRWLGGIGRTRIGFCIDYRHRGQVLRGGIGKFFLGSHLNHHQGEKCSYTIHGNTCVSYLDSPIIHKIIFKTFTDKQITEKSSII